MTGTDIQGLRRARRRGALLIAWLLAALTAAGIAAGPATAQEVHRIAAVVNDDIISAHDLQERLKFIIATSNLPDGPETRRRLTTQVLRGLIDERLRLQEAARLNIEVTDEEIDDAIARVEAQNKMRPGQFRAFLARRGIGEDTALAQIRAQIAWAKAIRRKFSGQVSIGEEDIDIVLRRFQESQGRFEYRVAEIFIGAGSPDEELTARESAERLADQARAGGDFAALARQFSQGAAAAVGGDIGWVLEGQLAAELDAALGDMAPGQIAGPIRTLSGYHVLLLRDRRQVLTAAPEETVFDLRQLLFPLPKDADPAAVASQSDLASLVAESAGDCADFTRLAQETGSPLPADPGRIKAGDMAPQLREIALRTEAGKTSVPLQTPAGILVFMVCDRTAPTANLPTRAEIRERLTNEQVEMLARRYLRDLRFAALVDLRV